MAVFNIHAGHNPDGKVASGAVGFVKESIVNREIKNKLIEKLRTLGHTVYDCTEDNGTSANDVLKKIVKKCNAHKADLDISIHLNAGGGKGVEVLVYKKGSTAEEYGNKICSSIAGLGFVNRGVKVRNNLYVLKNTKATAVIIESFFCDSQEDVNRFNLDTFTNAVIKGLTDQDYKPEQNKPHANSDTKYKVGQHVVFGSCYRSSTDPIGFPPAGKALTPSVNHGIITKIYAGRNNPYLINDGQCFVNDGDISGFYSESAQSIKIGDYVTPTRQYDYNGTHLAKFVLSNSYPVVQIKGDRVVLGGGLDTAFRIKDLRKN